MEHPAYQEVVPSAPDPPPYFEKEPYSQQPPPAYSPENPVMPTQYQRYYDAPQGAMLNQGPVVQFPPQSVYVIPVQPPQAPDYLKYSIFSMFCCVPLGIAAVIYSVRVSLSLVSYWVEGWETSPSH